MKIILYIFSCLFLLTSCYQQTQPIENKKTVDKIDTIIEKNNPNSLDLTKHQLFIDTTRTNEYYEIEKRNPFSKEIAEIIASYMSDLYPDSNLNKFDFKDFPRVWVPLEKYKGEFIFYNACDGNDNSYDLTESIFYIFGGYEPSFWKIKRKIKLDANELEIELENYIDEQNKKPLKVQIKRTDKNNIFTLTMNSEKPIFITPNTNVRNFDVLVNHCTITKVSEFYHKLD